MDIYPLGHASFRLKGKMATVVTDPFDPMMVGLKMPKVEMVDIVTVSHAHGDHNSVGNINGTPFIISGPGEYEVKGVTVIGVSTYHDASQGGERGKNVVYKITMDGINVCHLGDLGHKLSDSQVNDIGDVDILLVPVGGFYTISAEVAAEVVAQIEPSIVVPMHYYRNGIADTFKGKIDGVDKFLKETGAEGTLPQNKLTVTPDKLPETTTVVVLE